MQYELPSSTVGNAVPVPPPPRPEREIMTNWIDGREKPLVSIICHTYQHAAYIRDALNGFLMQETGFPFEIVIHDDASTDGTREIVEEYAKLYPNIFRPILQKENQYSKGYKPMRFTLPRARGSYIALCEGDDYWLDKEKLDKQVNFLESNTQYVMCFHGAYKILDGYIQGNLLGNNTQSYNREALLKAPFVPTLTRLFRNHPFPWADRNDCPVAMDIVFSSYLSRYGGAGFVTNIIPSAYRVHSGGIWSEKTIHDKTRVSVDSLLFIASAYAKERNLRASKFFEKRAIRLILKKKDLKGFSTILNESLFKLNALKKRVFRR